MCPSDHGITNLNCSSNDSERDRQKNLRSSNGSALIIHQMLFVHDICSIEKKLHLLSFNLFHVNVETSNTSINLFSFLNCISDFGQYFPTPRYARTKHTINKNSTSYE